MKALPRIFAASFFIFATFLVSARAQDGGATITINDPILPVPGDGSINNGGTLSFGGGVIIDGGGTVTISGPVLNPVTTVNPVILLGLGQIETLNGYIGSGGLLTGGILSGTSSGGIVTLNGSTTITTTATGTLPILSGILPGIGVIGYITNGGLLTGGILSGTSSGGIATLNGSTTITTTATGTLPILSGILPGIGVTATTTVPILSGLTFTQGAGTILNLSGSGVLTGTPVTITGATTQGGTLILDGLDNTDQPVATVTTDDLVANNPVTNPGDSDPVQPLTIPEPSSSVLLLTGLAFFGRRRRKSANRG